MTCHFMSFLKVFQSYRDDGWAIMSYQGSSLYIYTAFFKGVIWKITPKLSLLPYFFGYKHTCDIFLEPDREIWDFSEGDWGLR